MRGSGRGVIYGLLAARGAVEAANRHLQHGLEALDLKTIVAFSRSDNVASRRVLEKIDVWFVAHED